METFAHYLQIADNDFDTTTTPPAHSDVPTIASRRFRKVSALSDFAPVNLKVSRRSVTVACDFETFSKPPPGIEKQTETTIADRNGFTSWLDGPCWYVLHDIRLVP